MVEKPRAKLGKSGKEIASRQARITQRRQADAKLLRRMQQLQGSVGRPAPPKAPKVPLTTTQFTIGTPPRGKKRPLLPIQDIARAFAQTNHPKRARFNSALNHGNMLADLLDM